MTINNKTIFLTGAVFILIVITISLLRTMSSHAPSQTKKDHTQLTTSSQIDAYKYTEISAKKLREMMRRDRDNVGIVDIRSTAQFKKEHIILSSSLPADTLISGGVAPRYNKNLIVVLFNELDTETINQAVNILKKSNQDVKVLSGGITLWKNNGGATLTTGDPSSIVDIVKTQYIDATTVVAIIKKKDNNDDRRYIIVDVRPEAQYKNGHLPYAINMPLADLERTFDRLPATKDIIIYGALQRDSFSAGVQLYDLGFSRVHTLENGYIDWVRGDHQIINP